MKLFPALMAITLSALVAVQANAKTVQSSKSTAKQTETSKEVLLKRFNQSISLQFLGVDSGVDEQKQPMISFKYKIKNVGKKAIKTVHWASNFLSDKKLVLNYDIPVNFNKKGLVGGQEVQIALPIPVAKLPKPFITATNNGSKIDLLNVAKSITYVDGSRLVVNK
ncbi:hypothetical protein [Lonepinella sp. BR2474]|uniref:hypothetical protein n=1 Tax=Lonepinella sp. BR2474 TaxID=3434548 RepID=UPI003F6DDCF4